MCLLPENLCPNALRKSFRGCDASGALYPNSWLSSPQWTGFQIVQHSWKYTRLMPEQQRHKVGYFHIQKSALQRKRLLPSNLLWGSLWDYLSIYSLIIKTHPRSFFIALAFKVQTRRHSSCHWNGKVSSLLPAFNFLHFFLLLDFTKLCPCCIFFLLFYQQFMNTLHFAWLQFLLRMAQLVSLM